MMRIITLLLTLLMLTACNKTSLSDRGGASGSAATPAADVPCHFVCTDADIPHDDNVIVCQECEDGNMPFCAEMDHDQSVVYCSNTLQSG